MDEGKCTPPRRPGDPANSHRAAGTGYDYLQELFIRLSAKGEERMRAAGTNYHLFTPAEKLAIQLDDEWTLVREAGFLCLFSGGWNGEFAAEDFDQIGLHRAAEIYRTAQSLLPAGCPHFGWQPETELGKKQLDLLETLSAEIKRFDAEIVAGLIAYLEALPADSGEAT